MKKCILYDDKICNDCGECNRCDLDPNKICDNCCKCLEIEGKEYSEFNFTELYKESMNVNASNPHKQYKIEFKLPNYYGFARKDELKKYSEKICIE